MIKTIINPPSFEDDYCRHLEANFPGWGGMPMYRWCFQRRVGGAAADILLLQSEGEAVAGAALTYRNLSVDQTVVQCAIVTGAWVSENFRKQGLFSRTIVDLTALVRERGVELISAFVRADNPSYKGLLSLGFVQAEASYLSCEALDGDAVDSQSDAFAINEIEASASFLDAVYAAESRRSNKSVSVIYDQKSWAEQFFSRPKSASHLYSLNGGEHFAILCKYPTNSTAVISYLSSRSGDSDSSRALKALQNLCNHEGYKLILYTADQSFARQAMAMGFTASPGFYLMLSCSAGDESGAGAQSKRIRQILERGLDFQDGDKM